MENHRPTIALMGPPGCGKGTQARVLAERLGLVHLSSGDIIRENIRRKTEIGKAFEEATAKGELGPTHLVTDMVRERLATLSAEGKSCVLDGFPRTLPQAQMLTGLGLPDAVIYISVSTDEVIRRISGRLSCSCGAIYHSADAPPKIARHLRSLRRQPSSPAPTTRNRRCGYEWTNTPGRPSRSSTTIEMPVSSARSTERPAPIR